jgi:prolyl-tRNA synthetase
MLPLGLRVQNKLEALIDKHMRTLGMALHHMVQELHSHALGASKVSLSTISSEELWEQSGRLTEGSEVRPLSMMAQSALLIDV